MIKTVTMYSVVCDRCGKTFIDEFNGIGAWLDEGTAKEQAMESEWAEMQKHQPFGWVKDKDTQKFLVCKALGKLFFIGIEDKPYNYKEVLRDYTFADGTPFGVEVEE